MANKNPEWSANVEEYFQEWMNILHSNNCKHECDCYEGAYRLATGRIQCIRRGMPDLDIKLDKELWKRAFEIHNIVHGSGYSNHIITPTWSDPKDKANSPQCDCFEKALEEHEQILILGEKFKKPEYKKPKPPPKSAPVFMYDPYSEDREV